MSNIRVELRHETGRTETIPNTRTLRRTDESTIEVEYIIPSYDPNEVQTDEYDGLSWEVTDVRHTETSADE